MAVEAAVDREALQATAVAVVAEATTAVAVDAPVVVTAGIGNPSRRLKRFLPSGSRSCSQFLEPSFRATRLRICSENYNRNLEWQMNTI